MTENVNLEELQNQVMPVSKTDQIHKMGRQILNLASMVFVFVLLMCGKDISPVAGAILAGGNIAYQLVKGKGQ